MASYGVKYGVGSGSGSGQGVKVGAVDTNLRSGSIFVSLCNNIPADKAKREQPILAVAVRENV